MKPISNEDLIKFQGGESAWVCAGYTAATLATGLLTGAGMALLAGFTIACWASVE